MPSNQEIGSNIKKYRNEKKMTQKELADKLGKAVSSVQKYEAGTVEVPINVMDSIAQALGVDMERFLGMKKDPFSKNGQLMLDFVDDSSTISEEKKLLLNELNALIKESDYYVWSPDGNTYIIGKYSDQYFNIPLMQDDVDSMTNRLKDIFILSIDSFIYRYKK